MKKVDPSYNIIEVYTKAVENGIKFRALHHSSLNSQKTQFEI